MTSADRDPLLSGWDPLSDLLRASLMRRVNEMAPRALLRRRKPRIRLAFIRGAFYLRHSMIEILFATSAMLLSTVGAGIIIVAYPWHTPGESYSEVVATIAAATAFSSVIVSAIAIPQAGAATMAPGYTAELLTRRTPWLIGFALVILGAVLFGISTTEPNATTALGSGLLTAGSFAAVWWISRLLLRSADSLEISQRQARYIQKSFVKARGFHRSMVSAWLPRVNRTEENIWLLTGDEILRYLAGFMRHQGSGIASNLAAGRPSLVVPFVEAMIETFLDHARSTKGAVRGPDGPIQLLLENVRSVVVEGNARQGEFDRTAQHCISLLPKLIDASATSPEYSATRVLVVRALTNCLDMCWHNDTSFVPATGIKALGIVAEKLLSISAFDDAHVALDVFRDMIARAISDDRPHISTTAASAFVKLLPGILSAHPMYREELLDAYLETVDLLAGVHPNMGVRLYDPTKCVVPGVALHGVGLQEVLWESELDTDGAQLLAESLIPWLGSVIAGYAALDEDRHDRCLQDGLALLLCLQLRFAYASFKGWQTHAAEAATRWVHSERVSDTRSKLLRPGVAELVWSCLLVAAAAADSPALLSRFSAELKAIVVAESPQLVGQYTATFIQGLFIASGSTSDEAFTYLKPCRGKFGFRYDGMHIAGFGNAPAMNRNRTAHPSSLIENINEWAVSRFPEFQDQAGR